MYFTIFIFLFYAGYHFIKTKYFRRKWFHINHLDLEYFCVISLEAKYLSAAPVSSLLSLSLLPYMNCIKIKKFLVEWLNKEEHIKYLSVSIY